MILVEDTLPDMVTTDIALEIDTMAEAIVNLVDNFDDEISDEDQAIIINDKTSGIALAYILTTSADGLQEDMMERHGTIEYKPSTIVYFRRVFGLLKELALNEVLCRLIAA